jgi:hypothetical protein
MPESGDLELVNAAPEGGVQPLKAGTEMLPEMLARTLAWIPDQSESRDFSEPSDKLLGAFEPQ